MTVDTTIESIYRATLPFLVALTPEETYAIIVREAIRLVGASYGSILLVNNEKNKLERVYASSPLAYKTTIRKAGNTYKAFRQRKTILADISEMEKAHKELKRFGVREAVFIPLSYRGKSIGVLTVNSLNEKKFTKGELEILTLFGSMASLAIRKTQLYDETKKALAARDFFLSMAAHELKTPVTTIYGYAQLLSDSLTRGRELKAGWIGSLRTECERLKFLINDLLEANRISAGLLHYDLRECSIKEIISRVVNNFRVNYPDRKFIFVNSLRTRKDTIIGDYDRLMQVLINLLENAAKFSSVKSKISLTLKFDESSFVIVIKDKGKGIAKKDLPKIFDRYYKGLGTYHEGLGLGLFLVKSIIERHHGSIRIYSQVNKGTLIEIYLPKLKL